MSTLESSDDAFLAMFERAAFADFPHRAHLRMAWLYVRRLGSDAALDAVTAGIRALAGAHGHPERYHETLTRAWVHLVESMAARDQPRVDDFDSFIEQHSELLDRDRLRLYYSHDRLWSPTARAQWLEPDLRPFAGAAGVPAGTSLRRG